MDLVNKQLSLLVFISLTTLSRQYDNSEILNSSRQVQDFVFETQHFLQKITKKHLWHSWLFGCDLLKSFPTMISISDYFVHVINCSENILLHRHYQQYYFVCTHNCPENIWVQEGILTKLKILNKLTWDTLYT